MPLRTTMEERFASRKAQPVLQQAIKETDFGEVVFRNLSPGRLLEHERALKSFARAGVIQPEDEKEGEWPSLEKGSAGTPTLRQLQWWITWQLIASDGKIGPEVEDVDGVLRPPYIKRTTAQTSLRSLVAGARRNMIEVPKAILDAAFNYICSDKIEDFGKYNTASLAKPIADFADLALVIREIWTSPIFRTPQMRAQMAFGITVSAYSSERPGALWESGKYRGSNDALCYGDLTPWVFAHPDDPSLPGIVVILVAVRLLKGLRNDLSADKHFLLYPEPDETRLHCPVHILLALALRDGALKDVRTIEEVLDVSGCTLGGKRLFWQDAWLKTPVMRAEERDPLTGGWTISRTRAMTDQSARNYLKQCCLSAGLSTYFTGYGFRRAAANLFAESISEDQRKLLMGHAVESHVYQHSYMTRLSTINIQALHARRGEGEIMPLLFARVARVSTLADPSLPSALTPAQIVELEGDEQIVKAQAAIDTIKADLQELQRRAKDADSGDLTEEIAAAYRSLARNKCTHTSLWQSLNRSILAASRKQAYEQVAATGKHAGPDPRAAAFTTRTSAAQIGRVGPLHDVTNQPKTSGIDSNEAMDDFGSLLRSFNPLQHYLDISAARSETHGEQLIASVQALVAMPTSFATTFYPDESPTADYCCPVKSCSKDLVPMGQSAASHIHECLEQQAILDLTAELEEAYSPVPCPFPKCACAQEVFPTRVAYVRHVAHVHTFRATTCKWPEDKTHCKHTLAHLSDGQSVVHVASAHGVNLNAKPKVDYCFLCNTSLPDPVGDRLSWTQHLQGHFDEKYAPFAHRTATNAPHGGLAPVGPIDKKQRVILPDDGDYSVRPRLDGKVFRDVVVHPWFCPFCLFDEDSLRTRWDKRMHQYTSPSALYRHIRGQHIDEVEPEDRLQCPVPCCGGATYCLPDLFDHLVLQHALPVYGAVKGQIRRLNMSASAPAKLRLFTPDSSSDEASPVERDIPESSSDALTRKRKREVVDVDGDIGDASGTGDTTHLPRNKARKDDPSATVVRCETCKGPQFVLAELETHRAAMRKHKLCTSFRVMLKGQTRRDAEAADFHHVTSRFPEVFPPPPDPTAGRVFEQAAVDEMLIWLRQKRGTKPAAKVRPGPTTNILSREQVAKRKVQHMYADNHGDTDVNGWWAYSISIHAAKCVLLELNPALYPAAPSPMSSPS